MKELVSARSDLDLVDVHELELHGFPKWLGLIRVLESFFYKDLSKSLAKFWFMMGGYKLNWRGIIVYPYWIRIPYQHGNQGATTCRSKFSHLFVHYKQGFLSLQGEQKMTIF
jgi:hypothetical protein